MKIDKKRTIIITDPCYISKDKDWCKGGVFDWEEYTINSPIFTDYIWDYTMCGDGMWSVYELKNYFNEQGLKEFVEDYDSALDAEDDEVLDKLDCNVKDELGTFTADSGCTGVFFLDEVLEYNPNFQSELCNKCYTIIQDFTGRIIMHKTPDNRFHILGLGNKIFYTN